MIAGIAVLIASAHSAKAIAAGSGGALVALGGSIIAQVTLDDLGIIPQLGAGTLIAGAGIYALRIVLRASAHERETATENEQRLTRALDRAEARADALEAEIEEANARGRRLLLAYDRERSHRLSLEAAGLVERRHTPPELEPDRLLGPVELDALGLTTDDLETPPDELGGA